MMNKKLSKLVNPDLVVYHGGCADGTAAGWVFWQHAKNIKSFKMPEFWGAKYGDDPIPLEKVRGKTVVVVDFSYDRGYTEKINGEAKQLVVLDHHKSHQKELEGLSYAIFDMSRAGCQIAWDYIYPPQTSGKARPNFINYIADRDLWTWKLPSSRAVNKALYLKNYTSSFEEVDKLRTVKFEELAREGRVFVIYEDRILEKLSRFWSTRYFFSNPPLRKGLVLIESVPPSVRDPGPVYKVMLIEAVFLQSELGNNLSEAHPDHDFAVMYRFDVPSQTWYFSCRAREKSTLDLGAILKCYGGGGHPKAAGFEIQSSEWPWSVFLTEEEYKKIENKKTASLERVLPPESLAGITLTEADKVHAEPGVPNGVIVE